MLSKILIGITIVSSASFGIDYAYEEGKAIYEHTCISCHGVEGNTASKMMLVVKPRRLTKTILTSEQSFKVIREGAHFWGAHADIMPTFKYVYSDDELSDVAHYISKAFNPDRDKKVKKLLDECDKVSKADEAKMLETGKKIYNRNCSMCHGVTGNGKSAYVEQSKAQDNFMYPYNLQKTLLDEDEIFLYTKFGGQYWGTIETDMPSWKRKYNDFQLKSVAKYVNEQIKKAR
jgi:mono/diheme cytochrome c family protein